MKNEENGKKIWETPEVFDLDVKETGSGIWENMTENWLDSPGSS
ncbi:MAG: hypothetical protein VB110_00795 [Bacteroidales bacterium]|nr:hypothetical protein [Bacteroidales bacterium]